MQAHFARARRFAARGEHQAGIAEVNAAGMLARELGDVQRMQFAGTLLEKFGGYEFAWPLLADAGRMEKPSVLPEWDGAILRGKTLLIKQRIRDLGAPIRMGRLVAQAAKRAERCIVLTEPRLVPLFSRTFPGVEIRNEQAENAIDAENDADVVASYETLCRHLAPDERSILGSFLPLNTDASRTADFQARYRGVPRVGISWRSSNTTKELPGLDAWALLLKAFPATYVSVQYGDTASDLETLRSVSGQNIIDDSEVDQLRDMDHFCAQLAALDAVLTISNTAAHAAGALGIPTFVVLGDKPTSMWPANQSTSPWYPRTALVRKQGHDWNETFARMRQQLGDAIPPAG